MEPLHEKDPAARRRGVADAERDTAVDYANTTCAGRGGRAPSRGVAPRSQADRLDLLPAPPISACQPPAPTRPAASARSPPQGRGNEEMRAMKRRAGRAGGRSPRRRAGVPPRRRSSLEGQRVQPPCRSLLGAATLRVDPPGADTERSGPLATSSVCYNCEMKCLLSGVSDTSHERIGNAKGL
jgi:hypothetical protein